MIARTFINDWINPFSGDFAGKAGGAENLGRDTCSGAVLRCVGMGSQTRLWFARLLSGSFRSGLSLVAVGGAKLPRRRCP
jgi:hypothetical protein